MFNFIKPLIATTEDKWIAFMCGIYGWFGGMQLSHFISVWWDVLLKAFLGLAGSSITILAGHLLNDFYKLKIKPKLFKVDDKDKKIGDNERAA